MTAFGDVCSSKPLFMSIYATVAMGIILSSIFIFSALYSSPEKPAGPWFSSSFSKSPRAQQYLDKNNVSLTSLEQDSKFTGGIWEVPAGDKMPDFKEFRLTKEMVEKRTKDNIIIMTFGNFAFMDFILTWVRHLTDLNVFNLLVGAMDTKLLEALYWKGVPVFDMGSHMNTIDVGWGSPTFHKMGREKVFLINSMLPYGVELLMCDTDMVWLKFVCLGGGRDKQ